jgi:glyoxalase family protein
VITFFPWPGDSKGRQGTGQVGVVGLSAPKRSLKYWNQRLTDAGVETRQKENTLAFADPDGIKLMIVEGDDKRAPWTQNDVPPEMAIRGLSHAEMWIDGFEASAKLLTDVMEFRQVAELEDGARFEVAGGGPGTALELRCRPDMSPNRVGVGVVHHIAFSVKDAEAQLETRAKMVGAGLNVTPVRDRQYFQSIYFREPSMVLYEIATNGPGFAIDEDQKNLGSLLKLPSQYEPYRDELRRSLPKFESHGVSFP